MFGNLTNFGLFNNFDLFIGSEDQIWICIQFLEDWTWIRIHYSSKGWIRVISSRKLLWGSWTKDKVISMRILTGIDGGIRYRGPPYQNP